MFIVKNQFIVILSGIGAPAVVTFNDGIKIDNIMDLSGNYTLKRII